MLLGYFGKLMKFNRKRSEINVLYRNYNYVFFRTFNNEKPIEVATLSLTLMHSF